MLAAWYRGTSSGEDRPTAEDAAEATKGAIALVDGTLWPCWSWDGHSTLWSGKCKTTGHGSLIATNLQGRITFVSEPVTGNQHDMAKLKGSDVEKILKKAGGVFADKGYSSLPHVSGAGAADPMVAGWCHHAYPNSYPKSGGWR